MTDQANPTEASTGLATPATSGVLLTLAHPALERSRANRALAKAAKGLDGVTFHDLYETYPDFAIDIEAEQERLLAHDVIAVQFPLYWYATPALLKEWFDLVWLHGFAYGLDGNALAGKRLFAACTTGGAAKAYHAHGYNRFSMDEFLRPLEQTAYLCGMVWETPFVVHGAATKDDEELKAEAQRYRARLGSLLTMPADAELGA
ncbi:NAD(P)H-dependent oxidoreductase [Caulobacter sp. UNC279MFTsu5.1]|uniref:glutathione-regulated potassium-efflux system oxidoreductase KefF n=1 Tax=Caulobacter sp. UNC279MFTsu5.1 TaxID=1502775 RepID=UPI0008E01A15|nr:NAD(P)H-dependent oxidoreductase [Caulobacter sp. UNC279MFTsu5.1]SFJ73376.1 Kef-type potassium/proton antiporter accessory protein, CPA2 family [Caulobacter sp. UNC279MFTsu5.1]